MCHVPFSQRSINACGKGYIINILGLVAMGSLEQVFSSAVIEKDNQIIHK